MDTQKLQSAALALEEEVRKALAAGYSNADCVFTPEVKVLLPLAIKGMIAEPIELQFTAGPAYNFSETPLGNCHSLEQAWAHFRSAIEDWDSRPSYSMLRSSMEKP